jgi:hypothetical protein
MLLRAITIATIAVASQQPDPAQKALDQIYATIEKAISDTKAKGGSAVQAQIEDPQYEDGFSDGFKALVILICRHFTSEGYQIGIATDGPKVQIHISWTDIQA